MITESVPAALAGERLDRIVALIGDLSRAEAAATIAAGGVRVDGGAASSGKVRLQEGQTVEVDPRAIPEPVMPTADDAVTFGVVYEDDAVIVVDKPAGLVVHPGAGNMDGTLVSGLLARYPELEGVGRRPDTPWHRASARRGEFGTAGGGAYRSRCGDVDRAVRRPQRDSTLRLGGVGCS
jgi:23S rRNA pseudouridine1911/1915/1917 synthase